MDASVNFLFDAVVTHMEVFGVPFEKPLELKVTLKFMGQPVMLTSSRLNVSGFVANRELQFRLEPDKVRQSLEEKGMSLSVAYQGTTLGAGTMTFPTEFLDKISPTMNDLLLVDTLDLQRRDDVVGTVSILLRLTLKCDEATVISLSQTAAPDRQTRESRVSCAGQGSTINPQDIMFLVGDPDPLLQVPTDPCSDLPSEEGEERLRLDLQRYRKLNSRVIFPMDEPCPKQKPSFSQLKKLTEKYSQIIDSVAEKVNDLDCPTEAVEDVSTVTIPRAPCEERFIPVPVRSECEDLPGVKPIRYCPVCLCAMSWLPKYTPCPRCNTRTKPMLTGQDSKVQLTAMQIVAEQLVRPKVSHADDDFCRPRCPSGARQVQNRGSEGDECPPCQCTCSKGKMCAHCRIRQICEDIYERKSEPACKPPPEPQTDEDFCVVADCKIDEQPYLSRVFSEMKSLYELHDTRKLSALQLRCQSQTLLHPRRSIKELTEELYQGGKNRHTRPGIHDHRQKAGHKRCLRTERAVSRRHGWNWATSSEARSKGWRPGAILRASGLVMRYFLLRDSERNLCQEICRAEEDRQSRAQPVLNICKRNGEIFVTLRPLATLGKRQKPITFRIVKSQLAAALRQIKRSLKDQGFEKCICHKSLMMCTCRDALEKFELNKALRKECGRRLMEPCPEHLVLTDTSISDMEFDLEVTPPAGTRWPEKLLPETVNHSTQTRKRAPKLKPRYPVMDNPYYRAYDCAAGDRYLGTAFGMPGEHVFEDGVFGMAGGGPHGPSPMPCGRPRLPGIFAGISEGTGRDGGGGMFSGGRGRRQGAGPGHGGPGGHGVPVGPGGGAWKGFPAAIGGKSEKDRKGGGKPIRVRFPQRFLKPAQDAAKAAKQAEMDALEKKKKGTNIMKYLQEKGTLERPWNPDEGKDKRPRPDAHAKGPDSLTVFQRRRKELPATPLPPLSQIPRRGKGIAD